MAIVALLLADNAGWEHMSGWGGGWMWLMGMPIMIGFVVLILWLFRAGCGSAEPARREPTNRAQEILSERYAKGELSTEEYQERSSELR